MKCSKTDKQYSGSSVRKMIEQRAKEAGMLMKVTTHSKRYAYGTHHVFWNGIYFKTAGTDLVTLEYQLGQESIRTTINYVKLCQV